MSGRYDKAADYFTKPPSKAVVYSLVALMLVCAAPLAIIHFQPVVEDADYAEVNDDTVYVGIYQAYNKSAEGAESLINVKYPIILGTLGQMDSFIFDFTDFPELTNLNKFAVTLYTEKVPEASAASATPADPAAPVVKEYKTITNCNYDRFIFSVSGMKSVFSSSDHQSINAIDGVSQIDFSKSAATIGFAPTFHVYVDSASFTDSFLFDLSVYDLADDYTGTYIAAGVGLLLIVLAVAATPVVNMGKRR